MSGTIDKLSSLFSGNVFVGLVFEFDEFSDTDNGRVASWIEENRESFIFKAEPTVSLPQVGDRFEIDGDFALEIRKRVFRVYGEAEPSILLQCAVIDDLVSVDEGHLDFDSDNDDVLRIRNLLEQDILNAVVTFKGNTDRFEIVRVRLYNILSRNGFKNFADVCQYTKKELSKGMIGIGHVSFRLLEMIVSNNGLEFGMKPKEYGVKARKIL